MSEHETIHRFPVQPGLNVAIEGSLCILLEVTTADGEQVIARSDALSDCDRLKDALDLARVWVSEAESDADSARMRALADRLTARRVHRTI